METETAPLGTSFNFTLNFEETDPYPLTNRMNVIIMMDIIYLCLVLKVIPNFMKYRQPFQLRNTIAIYNAIQVLVSAYFVYVSADILLETGLFPSRVVHDDVSIRKKMIFCLYVYFWGKVSELLDTIFFCLRKKYNQVSFLHVYHHAATLFGTFILVRYSISTTAIYGCCINSLVHVVMYFYYGVAALGPEYAKYLTWKKHITSFQLIQFVSIFLHQIISLIVTSGTHSLVGVIYISYSTCFFFYLFSQFYKQSYNKSNKVDKAPQNGTLSLNQEKEKSL